MSDLTSTTVTYADKTLNTGSRHISLGVNSTGSGIETSCSDDATFWTYFVMITIAFIILTFQLCATYLSIKCLIMLKQVQKGIRVACVRRQTPGYNCSIKNFLLSYLHIMKKNGHLISDTKPTKGGGSARDSDSQKKVALRAALSNALSPAGRCWQNRELLFADMCTYFSLYNVVESPHAGFKCKTRFKNEEEKHADKSTKHAAEKFDPKGSGVYEDCTTAKSKASKRITQYPQDSFVNDDSRAEGSANKSAAGGAIMADLTTGSAHKKVSGAKTANKQVKKTNKTKR